jgi:hypothetical protein
MVIGLDSITRDGMISVLTFDVAEVTFTKNDGTERLMKCTLQKSIVPASTKEEGTTTVRKINEQVLPVWDIDKSAWRSFRVDSVKGIKVL